MLCSSVCEDVTTTNTGVRIAGCGHRRKRDMELISASDLPPGIKIHLNVSSYGQSKCLLWTCQGSLWERRCGTLNWSEIYGWKMEMVCCSAAAAAAVNSLSWVLVHGCLYVYITLPSYVVLIRSSIVRKMLIYILIFLFIAICSSSFSCKQLCTEQDLSKWEAVWELSLENLDLYLTNW